MNRDSLRCFRLVLPFVLLASPAWSKELHPEVTTVKVSVYNDADLSPGLLADLEKVAARVFRQAAVNLEWLNCGQPSASEVQRANCTDSRFPTHLHLRLIGHPLHLDGDALGIAYLAEDGVGFQADVFCERVMRIQYQSQVDPAILLGTVSAHELGHLLLGTSSHSPGGLMRRHWHRNDLLLAVKNILLFSDDQSDHMRAKLYEAYLDRNRARLAQRLALASDNDSLDLPGASACFVYSRVYVRLSFAYVSPAAYLMCSDAARPSLSLWSVNGAEASFPID